MGRFLITVATSLAAQSALAFQNEPSGFRGLPWGTAIETVKAQFELTEDTGTERTYARTGDKPSIGDAQLDYIRYQFYGGRFATVYIVTLPGAKNWAALMNALTARFGNPSVENELVGRYFWIGKTARIGLHCGALPNCELVMESTVIADEKKHDEARAAKKAGERAKKDF